MRIRLMRWKELCLYILTISVIPLLALLGSHAVTTFAENSPMLYRSTVIIDAGHGGVDGGATSCTGVLESQINLEIALKLEDLMHLLGMETTMVRRTDISVYTEGETIGAKKISDLKERVRLVNSVEDGLLVSIHQNHFSDSRYHGAQLFYAKTGDSEHLAKELQLELIRVLNPGSNRQAKQASGVYLMEHIEKTGVLIECGFLSNPEEEALLRNEVYQRKLCCVIVANLSRYLANT